MANLEELRAVNQALESLPEERKRKREIRKISFGIRLLIENIEDGAASTETTYVEASDSLLRQAKSIIYAIN